MIELIKKILSERPWLEDKYAHENFYHYTEINQSNGQHSIILCDRNLQLMVGFACGRDKNKEYAAARNHIKYEAALKTLYSLPGSGDSLLSD